jgi:hypothetical protein
MDSLISASVEGSPLFTPSVLSGGRPRFGSDVGIAFDVLSVFTPIDRSRSDSFAVKKSRDFVLELIAPTGAGASDSFEGGGSSTLVANSGELTGAWPELKWDNDTVVPDFATVPVISVAIEECAPIKECGECSPGVADEDAFCWACGMRADTSPATNYHDMDNDHLEPFRESRSPSRSLPARHNSLDRVMAGTGLLSRASSGPILTTSKNSLPRPRRSGSEGPPKRVRFSEEVEECETFSKEEYKRGKTLNDETEVSESVSRTLYTLQHLGEAEKKELNFWGTLAPVAVDRAGSSPKPKVSDFANLLTFWP